MRANVKLPAADGACQAVHLAHKLQYEAGCRFTPHPIRRISLFDIALTHHHYPIRHFRRFFLIVGDKDAGEFQFFM